MLDVHTIFDADLFYQSIARNQIGRKEMLYLMTLPTHFILRFYGVGYMIKDHSDSEKGNPLQPLHGLLFLIRSKVSFICTILQTG